jgi:hypothetical protein
MRILRRKLRCDTAYFKPCFIPGVQASPLRRNLYTLYFYTYFGAFQLNLGTFCLQFVDVSLNFDTLKLNWVTKIGIFRISGINLSHLGAYLSILGAKKTLQGSQIVKYP